MTVPVYAWGQYQAFLHNTVLAPPTHDAFVQNEQRLIRSTERVAAILQAASIPCERTDCLPITLVNTITQEKIQLRLWRNVNILPINMVMKRRNDALELELYCQSLNPKRLRMRLTTSGERCPVHQVGKRIGFLLKKHRLLHYLKWFTDVAELISIGIEFPVVRGKSKRPVRDRKGRLLFHVHAHTIIFMKRWLSDAEWAEFNSKWHAHFGTVCPDSGVIRDLREACKYPLKGDDLEVVCKSGEVVELHHQLKGRHLFQPYGNFRLFRRKLDKAKQKVKRLRRPNEPARLVLVNKQTSTRVHYNRDQPSRSPAIDIWLGLRGARASQKDPRVAVWEAWLNLKSTPEEARRKRKIKLWTPPGSQPTPAAPDHGAPGQVHTITLNDHLPVDELQALQKPLQDQVTYTLRPFIPRPAKPRGHLQKCCI